MIDVIGVVFFPPLCYGGFFDMANTTNFLIVWRLPLRCGTLFISLTIKITNKRNFNNETPITPSPSQQRNEHGKKLNYNLPITTSALPSILLPKKSTIYSSSSSSFSFSSMPTVASASKFSSIVHITSRLESARPMSKETRVGTIHFFEIPVI